MTHKLDADDLFIHCVQRFCAEAALNFFLAEPIWIEAFHARLREGTVWPRVLLNMHSEHHLPDDIFHQLVKLASERGCLVIDPIDRALAAFDKSRLHPKLVEAGIPVPFSVIVPRQPRDDWRLNEEDRATLGYPFVIKPAMGYGRRGLVMDASNEYDLARSVSVWRDERYLFQRRITPDRRNGGPLYWRVYFVFGSVWISWWNCENDLYRMVTCQERAEFGLDRVEDLIRRIATLTGMTFFSSEVAQTESGDLIVIDYVNDQCHLLSQSAHPQMGVPDELVVAIARRIVEAARDAIHNPPEAPVHHSLAAP